MGSGDDRNAQYPLRYRHLFEFEAAVAPEYSIARGEAPARLAICYFTGGHFSGDRLRGILLPGGGDWADYRTEQALWIDVRGLLETDDGARIYMQYRGVWCAAPGALTAVLRRGEPYRHEDHYLRVAARFETDAARYRWLNSVVVIGVGGYADGGVHYSFYEIQ
jgi:hypothetical protein